MKKNIMKYFVVFLLCSYSVFAYKSIYIKKEEIVYTCKVTYGLYADEFFLCEDKDVLKLVRNKESQKLLKERLETNKKLFEKLIIDKPELKVGEVTFTNIKIPSDEYFFALYSRLIAYKSNFVSYRNKQDVNHYSSSFAYVLEAVRSHNFENLKILFNHYNSDFLKFLALRLSYFYNGNVDEITNVVGNDTLLKASMYDDYFFPILSKYKFSDKARKSYMTDLMNIEPFKRKNKYNNIFTMIKEDQTLFDKAKALAKAGFSVNESLMLVTNTYKTSFYLDKNSISDLYKSGYSFVERFENSNGEDVIPLLYILEFSNRKDIGEYLYELAPFIAKIKNTDLNDKIIKAALKNPNIKDYNNFGINSLTKLASGVTAIEYAWENRLYNAFFALSSGMIPSQRIQQRKIEDEELPILISQFLKSCGDFVRFEKYYEFSNFIYKEFLNLEDEYKKRFNKEFKYNRNQDVTLGKIMKQSRVYEKSVSDAYAKLSTFIKNRKILRNDKIRFSLNKEVVDIVSTRNKKYSFRPLDNENDLKKPFDLACLDDRLKPIDLFIASVEPKGDHVVATDLISYKSLVNNISTDSCVYLLKVSEIQTLYNLAQLNAGEYEKEYALKDKKKITLYNKDNSEIGIKLKDSNKAVIYTKKHGSEELDYIFYECEKSSLSDDYVICDRRVFVTSYGDINNDGIEDIVVRVYPRYRMFNLQYPTSESWTKTFVTAIFYSDKDRGHNMIMVQ
ncbi:hypothetical protein [Halobacteriovorax sp. RT-1-4]|uniref:hypothetical protein n=1 Tax=unclassified Halobacteriovorax TaxID=2639665 RepID=UPI00399A4E7D